MVGKRCWIYVRVSSKEQVKGYSLDEQTAACIRFFEYRFKNEGYTLGEPHIEAGVSTKYDFRQRPEGAKLFLGANRGDTIIFSKLDRAFRNTVDCLTTVNQLKDRGVNVVFLDVQVDLSTPTGEFFLTCMAAFARMERLRIGERSKEGVAAAKAKGKILGGPWFGTRRAGAPGHTYIMLYVPEFREACKLYRLIHEGWTPEEIYWWLQAERIERPRTPKELKAGKSTRWGRSAIAAIPARLKMLIELNNARKIRVVDPRVKLPSTVEGLLEELDYERDTTETEQHGSGTDGPRPDPIPRGSATYRRRDRRRRQREREDAERQRAGREAAEARKASESGNGVDVA